MKRTCTIQASFDFSDEADCAEKMRLAMGLSPIASAIFANSPVSAGEHRGRLSERCYYWQHCDRDRCGLFAEVFEEDWGFRRYVERILDTPMFFIRRQGKLIDLAGRSFRELSTRGIDGHRASVADFELQMTTLFPEARLKRVIEVRGADAGGPKMLCAVPALWKGILYDAQARKEAWSLVESWTAEERVQVWRDVARAALSAEVRGVSVLELAQELLRISQGGLRRQKKISRRGNDETFYLTEVERLLFEERRSPAGQILDLWRGPWGGDVRKLLEYARY
jgi:glutamate--cysteine ligase